MKKNERKFKKSVTIYLPYGKVFFSEHTTDINLISHDNEDCGWVEIESENKKVCYTGFPFVMETDYEKK